MRYTQFITDLRACSFAAIFHDARPADDFQIGDLRQLGQNVVLDAIGKGGVLLCRSLRFSNGSTAIPLLAGWRNKFAFPNDHSRLRRRRASNVHDGAMLGLRRTHFFPRSEDSSAARLDGLVL